MSHQLPPSFQCLEGRQGQFFPDFTTQQWDWRASINDELANCSWYVIGVSRDCRNRWNKNISSLLYLYPSRRSTHIAGGFSFPCIFGFLHRRAMCPLLPQFQQTSWWLELPGLLLAVCGYLWRKLEFCRGCEGAIFFSSSFYIFVNSWPIISFLEAIAPTILLWSSSSELF